MAATGGELRRSSERLAHTARKVLVIDVGGTHVKLYLPGRRKPLIIASGPEMTPKKMVDAVKKGISGQPYDAVSLGYPGPVVHNKPLHDPFNLGPGWMGFDFEKAFGRPIKVINDAAMQALGSYRGGCMLFLGLGTGLGSALIINGVLEPMELAHLPYKHGKTFEDYIGTAALKKRGKKKWIKSVFDVVEQLKNALQADYVILGGGNAKRLASLPPNTFIGDNEKARLGGLRLWHSGIERRGIPAAEVKRLQDRHRRPAR